MRPGCSLRSARRFGCELRTSAGRSCGPLRFRKGTAKSSFRMNCVFIFGSQPAECSPATPRSCGPPPPQAAARRSLTRSILFATDPQPSGWACNVKELRPTDLFKGDSRPRPARSRGGWACDVEEQPSARGRLRAAGRSATELDAKHLGDDRRLPAAAASYGAAKSKLAEPGRRLQRRMYRKSAPPRANRTASPGCRPTLRAPHCAPRRATR